MKKILFAVSCIVAALGLQSCNNDKGPSVPESRSIRLEVTAVGAAGTRMTGVTAQDGRHDSADEAKVNSLQVFVFNGDALDGYNASTTKSVSVSCSSGPREIYAVVNAPSLSEITTKTALMSAVSVLSVNATNFEMIGSKSETLQQDGSISIAVDRLAARVVIRGIKNSLSNEAQAANFKILAVYLTNVTGDVNYGKSPDYTVSTWYNKRGYQAQNNLGVFTYDAVNQTVAAGATNNTEHYFYTMPNGNPGAIGGAFTPRACRLVIRCEIAGSVYDYPILIGAVESNKSYEINLVDITRAGNVDDGNEPDDEHPDDTDEEEPVVGFEQSFEVTVNDWSVILLGNEGVVTI